MSENTLTVESRYWRKFTAKKIYNLKHQYLRGKNEKR